ncbi:MAG: hypothetical protein IJV38_03410 [Prevotella sp.]|nr:hypothetical protein [Prevotella sp.]
MKARRFLLALLPVAAAFALTSCSSDDASDSSVQPQTGGVKKIPYIVTIGNVTRAGVADDQSTLNFAAGDQLCIKGAGVTGMLSITEGVGTPNATFEGTLDYTGEGSAPAADLALTATLKSSNQQGWNSDGTVTLPASALCTSLADAVSKYSYLKGTSTFADKTFELVQQTTFLNFTVKMEGVAAGTSVDVSVKNGNGVIGTGSVTTAATGAATTVQFVAANFVVPVQGGTVLNGAQATVAGSTMNFGANQTTGLAAKVYNINKIVYRPGVFVGTNGYTYATPEAARAASGKCAAAIAYQGPVTVDGQNWDGLAIAMQSVGGNDADNYYYYEANRDYSEQFCYARLFENDITSPTDTEVIDWYHWFVPYNEHWTLVGDFFKDATNIVRVLEDRASSGAFCYYWSRTLKDSDNAYLYNIGERIWGYAPIDEDEDRAEQRIRLLIPFRFK